MTTNGKTPFSDELVDQLLAGYSKPEDLIGNDGILKQLTARLVERALQGEMTAHLGYEKHDPKGRGNTNSRNGTSSKTLKTELGPVDIEVPRDRDGSFEPQLVKKRQTRFTGFDEKILGMYARGMTVRDIQGHLEDVLRPTVPSTAFAPSRNRDSSSVPVTSQSTRAGCAASSASSGISYRNTPCLRCGSAIRCFGWRSSSMQRVNTLRQRPISGAALYSTPLETARTEHRSNTRIQSPWSVDRTSLLSRISVSHETKR